MNDCDVEAVEALFRGELTQAKAARVSAHLAVCPECKEELRWLERERRFFQSRERATPPPPSLAEVLAATRAVSRPRPIAQSKRAAPGRARWMALGFGLAAAFLLGAVVLFASRSPSPEVAADPPRAPSSEVAADPRNPNADEPRTVPHRECYACSPASDDSLAEPQPPPESEPCDELGTSSGVTFPVSRPQEK